MRIEVEAAEMEVNRLPESIAAAIAVGDMLEHLDDRVETLRGRVGNGSSRGQDDATDVALNRACGALDRLEAGPTAQALRSCDEIQLPSTAIRSSRRAE